MSEAGKLSEAAERLRHSLHGVPAPLPNAGNAGAGRAPLVRRQTEAAARFRQQGGGLIRAGKLPAAITALREAIRLDPADAGSHHALGLALLRSNRLAEATASFELAIVFGEDVAAAHHNLAVALDRQGLTDKAMAAYRRAVELAPALAGTHRRLAELLEAEGDVEDAAASYRRAAAADPDTTLARLSEANALLLDGDFRQAEALLRQAIALDPAGDRLHVALGNVLAMHGHFDEAIAAFDRALALNPLQAVAHLAAVQAKKSTAADRPRLDRMLAALDRPGIDDTHRVSLHFAIGKALDDLGEYRLAMWHFDRANEIRRRTAQFEGPGLAEHVDRLVARYTPDFFAAGEAFGVRDETPLLIVGMPRSGTTLVEQIVSSHPAVAAGGELRFWIKRATPPGIAEATHLSAEAGRGLSRDYLALLRGFGPRRRPRDRQGAVQSSPAGPRSPAAARRAHHPLPPPSGRHLPVDLFHVVQGEDGFRRRPRRPRLRLPTICSADGALARRAAARPPD